MGETDILKEIGLTDSETKVYLALLDLGTSTRGELVKKSGVAGSKIYELLERLQEKGLASIYLQKGIKHFKPTNPEQILHYIEDKQEEMKKIEEEASQILPTLLARFAESNEEQEVELLSGIKGLEIIFREQVDMLNKGETCYVIGGTQSGDEEAMYAFFGKVHRWRAEKGIRSKMLYNKGQQEKISIRYDDPLTEISFIDHTSPVAINVWKGRTAILIFGKTVTAIYIKSEDVAQSFLEYFNILWQESRKTYQ